MRINLAALNAQGEPTTVPNSDHDRPVNVPAYPKDEPVLESSYLFPKGDSYGLWRITTPAAFPIPKNT